MLTKISDVVYVTRPQFASIATIFPLLEAPGAETNCILMGRFYYDK